MKHPANEPHWIVDVESALDILLAQERHADEAYAQAVCDYIHSRHVVARTSLRLRVAESDAWALRVGAASAGMIALAFALVAIAEACK